MRGLASTSQPAEQADRRAAADCRSEIEYLAGEVWLIHTWIKKTFLFAKRRNTCSMIVCYSWLVIRTKVMDMLFRHLPLNRSISLPMKAR